MGVSLKTENEEPTRPHGLSHQHTISKSQKVATFLLQQLSATL